MKRYFLALALSFLVVHSQLQDKIVCAQRPNVILIMADDLGYECLNSNGGTSYDSMLLDRLAAQGMRFTHCYSQPICTPSRNKIMTGRSNARNYRAFGVLVPGEVTFGNVMRQAQYKTCIAGKWQLSGGEAGNRSFGLGTTPKMCGFGESCMWAYKHNLPQGVEHTGGWEKRGRTSRYWHPAILQNGAYRPTTSEEYGPDIFTDFILEFIERNRNEQFFAYYPMALTHGPFLPTPHSKDLDTADRFQNDERYFADMISYTGHCVQRIVAKLDTLGIAENTLLLFTADNGTYHKLVSHMDGRIIPGGKGLPIDAGCRVPLIAYWKGTIEAGSVCTDLVDFSDFLPTIAEAGHATLPQDRPLDGRSFLPQLRGQHGKPRTSIFVHYDKDPQAKRPVFRRTRFAFDGRFKLYQDGRMFDIPRDWEEELSLDNAHLSGEAQAARCHLQQALDSMPPWTPDNSAFGDGPDHATTQRLKRLTQLRRDGQMTSYWGDASAAELC